MLAAFACPRCGPRIDTLPTASVWCVCGRRCIPSDPASWLRAVLEHGQRTRDDVVDAADKAGLPWATVTATARAIGIVRVRRHGFTVWRAAKEDATASDPLYAVEADSRIAA